jgi:F0F1-type ATP synthase assembly protein I
LLSSAQLAFNALNLAPSTFFQTLNNYLAHIAVLSEDTLSKDEDAIVTLSLLLNDFQRTAKEPSEIDQALVQALLASVTISAIQPKPEINKGRDIQPSNYLTHFKAMQESLKQVTLSPDTKRIMTDTVLPGLRHMIENEDNIIEHVTTRYGVLYYLSENLPLHTDHNESHEPDTYRQTLHCLIENCFGAFYIIQSAGKLSVFFDKLANGYCLEGRIRDTLTWAANYSEIKSFDEFMTQAHKEYAAYQKIMEAKTTEELQILSECTQFIVLRYKNFPCLRDDNGNGIYAPAGEITRQGIEQYLKKELYYDDNNLPASSEKAKLLNKIDKYVKNHRSFFGSHHDGKAHALKALRLALVYATNAKEEKQALIRWKEALSAQGMTNQELIRQVPRPFIKGFSFSQDSGKTEAEHFIEMLENTIDSKLPPPDKDSPSRLENDDAQVEIVTEKPADTVQMPENTFWQKHKGKIASSGAISLALLGIAIGIVLALTVITRSMGLIGGALIGFGIGLLTGAICLGIPYYCTRDHKTDVDSTSNIIADLSSIGTSDAVPLPVPSSAPLADSETSLNPAAMIILSSSPQASFSLDVDSTSNIVADPSSIGTSDGVPLPVPTLSGTTCRQRDQPQSSDHSSLPPLQVSSSLTSTRPFAAERNFWSVERPFPAPQPLATANLSEELLPTTGVVLNK